MSPRVQARSTGPSGKWSYDRHGDHAPASSPQGLCSSTKSEDTIVHRAGLSRTGSGAIGTDSDSACSGKGPLLLFFVHFSRSAFFLQHSPTWLRRPIITIDAAYYRNKKRASKIS